MKKIKYHIRVFWISNAVFDWHFFVNLSHLGKAGSIGNFFDSAGNSEKKSIFETRCQLICSFLLFDSEICNQYHAYGFGLRLFVRYVFLPQK